MNIVHSTSIVLAVQFGMQGVCMAPASAEVGLHWKVCVCIGFTSHWLFVS